MTTCMYMNNTCLNCLPEALDAVSMVNSVLNILHSFAPYPFQPPVTFFRSSKFEEVTSVLNINSSTYFFSIACISTGIPAPLFHTLILFSLEHIIIKHILWLDITYRSITILIVFILLSLCLLSAVFTINRRMHMRTCIIFSNRSCIECIINKQLGSPLLKAWSGKNKEQV